MLRILAIYGFIIYGNLFAFGGEPLWAKTPELGPPAQADIVIIGAGLSGLISAHLLKDQNVVILEASPDIGGRVSTVSYQVNGETISANSGMEEFWESNPIVHIIKELGLRAVVNKPASSIMIRGKLYEYAPKETKSEFIRRIFSPEEADELWKFEAEVAKVIESLNGAEKIPRHMRGLKDISFAAWVKNRKISDRVSEWIRIILEPEIGTEWQKISALDGLAEYHIFIGEGESSYQVIGGNQKLTDALSASVGRHKIFNRKVVELIERSPHGSIVHYKDAETGEHRTITCNDLIVTVPLPKLHQISFNPKLPNEKRHAIDSMNSGHYHKAHILLNPDAEKYFIKNDGSSNLPILTDSPLGVIYNGNSNVQTGVKILTILIHGRYTGMFDEHASADTQQMLSNYLEEMFPGIKDDIIGFKFFPKPHKSIAAWGPGRSRFDNESQSLRTPDDRIYFAGDFTESSHSDGAARSAMRVVKQISGRRATMFQLGCAKIFKF
jgi:monoamine oxidase